MKPCEFDGNATALREYEARQLQGDRMRGTEADREEFIEDRLAAEQKRMGVEYLFEAISECDHKQQIEIFEMFINGTPLEFYAAVKDVVRAYHLPAAERALEEHDFTPEPPEDYRGGRR